MDVIMFIPLLWFILVKSIEGMSMYLFSGQKTAQHYLTWPRTHLILATVIMVDTTVSVQIELLLIIYIREYGRYLAFIFWHSALWFSTFWLSTLRLSALLLSTLWLSTLWFSSYSWPKHITHEKQNSNFDGHSFMFVW